MSVTLSTIRTDVRNRLDETTARFWSNSELNTWINEACRDIAQKTESIQSFFTSLQVSENNAKYTMPDDVIRIHRVEFQPYGQQQTYPLTASSYQEMDQIWGINQSVQMSYPSYYALWGTPGINLTMQLYPVPSQAGSLNIFYYRLPKTLTNDTDTAEIPAGWEGAVALYCEYVAKRKDKDPTWQEAKQLYEEMIATMFDRTRQFHDQTQSISIGLNAIPNWLYGGEDW